VTLYSSIGWLPWSANWFHAIKSVMVNPCQIWRTPVSLSYDTHVDSKWFYNGKAVQAAEARFGSTSAISYIVCWKFTEPRNVIYKTINPSLKTKLRNIALSLMASSRNHGMFMLARWPLCQVSDRSGQKRPFNAAFESHSLWLSLRFRRRDAIINTRLAMSISRSRSVSTRRITSLRQYS